MALPNSSLHFALSLDLLSLPLKLIIVLARPLSGPIVFSHLLPKENHSSFR